MCLHHMAPPPPVPLNIIHIQRWQRGYSAGDGGVGGCEGSWGVVVVKSLHLKPLRTGYFFSILLLLGSDLCRAFCDLPNGGRL